MTRFGLILRSLTHRPRRHTAVVLCTAVTTAAITGSLLVGGSVDGSLRALEELRTGQVSAALRTPGRFFRAALADEIQSDTGTTVAPLLELPAVVGLADADEGMPGVRLIGVDDRFFSLGSHPLQTPPDEHVILSQALAVALHASPGSELTVRAEGGILPAAQIDGEELPAGDRYIVDVVARALRLIVPREHVDPSSTDLSGRVM